MEPLGNLISIAGLNLTQGGVEDKLRLKYFKTVYLAFPFRARMFEKPISSSLSLIRWENV